MRLTREERDKILLANAFKELPESLQCKSRQAVALLSQQYAYHKSKPSFMYIMRALESSMLIVDIEFLLLAFVPMSLLLTAVTVGIAALGILVLMSGLGCYYFFNCGKFKKQQHLETLQFAWLQEQAACRKVEDGSYQEKDSWYANQAIQQTESLPQNRVKTIAVIKRATPPIVIATGTFLTTGFAVPQLLSSLGIVTAAASFATPLGFAILGAAGLCLIAFACYSAYKYYQAQQYRQKYKTLLSDLQRSKESHLTLFEQCSKDKPCSRAKALHLLGFKKC